MGVQVKSEGVAAAAACRLLGKPHVLARIAVLQAELAERNTLTQDEVIALFRTNAARALQVEAVLDKDGNPIGTYVYDGAVVNKAAEMLGKAIGMFQTQKLEHTGKDGEPLLPPVLLVRSLDELSDGDDDKDKGK